MVVYILIGSFDYEGDTVLDVFYKHEDAAKEEEKYLKEYDSVYIEEIEVK